MNKAIKLAWFSLKKSDDSFFWFMCDLNIYYADDFIQSYCQIQYKTKKSFSQYGFNVPDYVKVQRSPSHLNLQKCKKTGIIVQNKPIAFLHGKLRNTAIDPRTLFHFTTWQSKHHLSLLAQSVNKTQQVFGKRFEERFF